MWVWGDEGGDAGDDLRGHEEDVGGADERGLFAFDGVVESGEGEVAFGVVDGDERESDAVGGGVLLEDDVDGVELGGGGDDVRCACVGVEDSAKTLAGGDAGDDGVGARGADEGGEVGAVLLLGGVPVFPGSAHSGLPELGGVAEVVFRLVERAAEGVVFEVDGFRGEGFGEEGEDVGAEVVFGEGGGAEGGGWRRGWSC